VIRPSTATAPRLRIEVHPDGGNVPFIDVELDDRSFTLDVDTAQGLANGIYEKIQLAGDCVPERVEE
jgi:hypothetical protein